MAARLVALLLLFLSPVHAAFTATTCSDTDLCVERSPTGSVCLYSNHSSAAWACNNATFQTPLEAHLGQHYAIGYYNGAQYLGGWNYSIPAAIVSPIVVCMSGRVNMTSAQYLTLCALTAADNSWSGGGCAVNVVPANVLDGCYAGVSVLFCLLTRVLLITKRKACHVGDDYFHHDLSDPSDRYVCLSMVFCF
jgi:hypothetical protein